MYPDKTQTHTLTYHSFNGSFSRATRVSWCQEITILDFIEARTAETLVITAAIRHAAIQSNHQQQYTNNQFFYRPDALPALNSVMALKGKSITFHKSAHYRKII